MPNQPATDRSLLHLSVSVWKGAAGKGKLSGQNTPCAILLGFFKRPITCPKACSAANAKACNENTHLGSDIASTLPKASQWQHEPSPELDEHIGVLPTKYSDTWHATEKVVREVRLHIGVAAFLVDGMGYTGHHCGSLLEVAFDASMAGGGSVGHGQAGGQGLGEGCGRPQQVISAVTSVHTAGQVEALQRNNWRLGTGDAGCRT